MLKKIILLCVVSFLIFILYQNKKYPYLILNSPSQRLLNPFDTRLRYKIADIDPRFGLSQQEAIQLSQEASNIWKDGTGREYFVYDPDAKLTIHFEYDERQSTTIERLQHKQSIEHGKNVWANKNQQINDIRIEISRANALLESKKIELDEQLNQFNRQIAHINQNGGLHPSQQSNYAQQRQYLEQNIQALRQEIQQYNLKINDLNTQVDELNQLNQQLNTSVHVFNQKFQPRMFDKGSFNGKSIHIFEFESKDDLRLTIAHELGHALGLQHNDDPEALMYPYMKDQNIQDFRLTYADLELLNRK